MTTDMKTGQAPGKSSDAEVMSLRKSGHLSVIKELDDMYASMRTKAQAMGYTDKDLAAFTPDVRRTLGFDRKLDDTTGTESTAVSPQSVGTVDMRASVGGVEKHREDTKGPAVTGPNASARAEHSATTPVYVVATPVTENKHTGCAENGGGATGTMVLRHQLLHPHLLHLQPRLRRKICAIGNLRGAGRNGSGRACRPR